MLEPGTECSRVTSSDDHPLSFASKFFIHGRDELVDVGKGLLCREPFKILVRPASLLVGERLRLTVVSMLEGD